MNPKAFPVCRNLGRALRPNEPYRFEPLLKFFSESPRPCVFDGPELLHKSKWAEDGYAFRLSILKNQWFARFEARAHPTVRAVSGLRLNVDA
jgi:hypothetical protein